MVSRHFFTVFFIIVDVSLEVRKSVRVVKPKVQVVIRKTVCFILCFSYRKRTFFMRETYGSASENVGFAGGKHKKY